MPEFMNDEEFHQAALSGGASRNVHTNQVPDRGFMVGGAGGDRPFPEIKRPVDQFSLDDVRHHANAIRNHFGHEALVHQGAWVEDSDVVLDASEQIPTYSSAITEAKMRGERAIYDVRRGKDRNTKDAKVVN